MTATVSQLSPMRPMRRHHPMRRIGGHVMTISTASISSIMVIAGKPMRPGRDCGLLAAGRERKRYSCRRSSTSPPPGSRRAGEVPVACRQTRGPRRGYSKRRRSNLARKANAIWGSTFMPLRRRLKRYVIGRLRLIPRRPAPCLSIWCCAPNRGLETRALSARHSSAA